MNAIQYARYGGAEILTLCELPKPTPGSGELLVKVKCASINPVDWKIASGKIRPILSATFPATPCFDIAGTIEAIGQGVSGFSVGQRVHVRNTLGSGNGAAEYARVLAELVAPIPEGMDDAQAAGLPLAGMTALQGLRNQSKMPLSGATQRILVVGASGGVGHIAVQVARAAGAWVMGVCSARNIDFVKSLGANEILDYTRDNAFAGLKDFDIVLDCVADNARFYLPMLKSDGVYASCLPGPGVILRSLVNPLTGKKARPVMLKSNAPDLKILGELFAAGKLRVQIDSRFPLEKLGEAWARSQEGRAVGKIILDVG